MVGERNDEGAIMALFDSTHMLGTIPAASQMEVFEALAHRAVELGSASDEAAVVADLKAREQESSTGFGGGIAIPHAKAESISKPTVLFGRVGMPVEWGALDGKPVSTFISILVPDGEGAEHLRILAKLARRLIHEDFANGLRTGSDAEVCVLIEGVLAE